MQVTDFHSFAQSVPIILDRSGFKASIQGQKQLLLKPNLTTNLPPPCTTPVALVEEVIKYCQKSGYQGRILIGEGSGGCETKTSFNDLGYYQLAKDYGLEVIDLNGAERVERSLPEAKVLKKIMLPKIVLESYLINLPVLKCHRAAKITGAMKNLYGLYLNEKPKLIGWWNKSDLHRFGVHESIYDLSLYLKDYFTLMDASVGQCEQEIHGTPCFPRIGKLLSGTDYREIDREGARLLGIDPKQVEYLNY